MNVRRENPLWWILLAASLLCLGAWMWPDRPDSIPLNVLIPASASIAFLALIPFPMGGSLVDLVHLITLCLFLILGPFEAGISLTIGMFIAFTVERLLLLRWNLEEEKHYLSRQAWGFEFSRQSFSLIGSAIVYTSAGGFIFTDHLFSPSSLPIILLSLSFSTLYLINHWIEHINRSFEMPGRQSFTILAVIAFLPAPFAILGATTYISLGSFSISILGAIAIVVSSSVRSLILAEKNLNRRVLELSTINRISEAMRTSLDLDELLETIYKQVSQLLNVDNFYIALLDDSRQTLTYPIALKGGRRFSWTNRPIADRLTDRVILNAKSILIPREAPQALKQMGLPELANAPEAWLGVPLLQPERALGCLAIFHTKKGQAFTIKDQTLLETIAGQAAAAIENALLFNQTRSRAQALSSLNRITTSMSSSLDPEKTLEMVSQSVIQVCGGDQSAIFLFNPDRSELVLAHAVNLSADFSSKWMILSDKGSARTAAFFDERIILVPTLSESGLEEEEIALLRSEGIEAYADLPLITPSGPIGQLSVYFTAPQHFLQMQVDLLETFAAQAALSVANARAHAETDYALRKRVEQLAALEAIGREMSATLNSETLFNVILEHALQMTRASRGHLALYLEEEDTLRVAAQHGYDDSFTLPIQYSPQDDIAGRAFHSGHAVRLTVSDLEHASPGWLHPSSRSVICIPLFSRDKAIGVLVVEESMQGAFTEEDERFLRQLAAQATVAISNAHLYQQIEARLREQSLLYQASAQIAASLDVEAVALATVDSLAVALEVDGVILSLWDQASNTLVAQGSMIDGIPHVPSHPDPVPLDRIPAISLALHARRPVQWTVAAAENDQDRAFLEEVRHCESILVVPLIAGEQTLGVLEAFSYRERAFDENVLRSAQTIASQAAIGMENTDLFQRVCDSNDRILAVLNSTNEGILLMDIGGNVLLANPQITDLVNLSHDDLLSMNITDSDCPLAAILGYSRQEFVRMLTVLQEGKTVQGEQVSFERGSHSLLRIDSPVQDAAGQVIGWLVVLRDISEERKLESAREHLTEMIVHDLRSPLTAILGSLALLEKVDPGSDAPLVEQALSVSRRGVEQMLGLVNSLLDIAKLESGDLPLEPSRFKLTKLLNEVIQTYIQEANQFGMILTSQIPETFPYITADRDKLQRVIVNLLDNALKFTPSGGQIIVRLERIDADLHLVIQDTGPGVPPEYREKIFERFSQIPGAHSRRRGTGLGLAFSKIAVHAHGGKIWVDTPEEGGSAFHVRLPIHFQLEQT